MTPTPSARCFALMLAPVCFLAACNPGGQDDSRVTELQAQVVALQGKLAALEPQLQRLNQRVEMSQMFKDWEGVAYLTPGGSGYAVVKMDLGNLTVSLTNITPYANGSKVALQFGNLTSATIEGLKAKVEWGPVDKDGGANNSEAKSREVTVHESLLPGAWNKSEVVLEGIPPISLGFVRVREVSHTAIRMRGR